MGNERSGCKKWEMEEWHQLSNILYSISGQVLGLRERGGVAGEGVGGCDEGARRRV